MKTALNPYLGFNGNAREAMEFYKSVLGGELTMQTIGESGMPSSEETKNNIMHAQLTAGDIVIMASDGGDHNKVTFGNNVSLSLVGTDESSLTETFTKLAEGGNIDMKLEKQFWGDTFGMLTDKFGNQWMVNISKGEQSFDVKK
jgi:PhnB protein